MNDDPLPPHSLECLPTNRAAGWFPAGCPRCEEALRREVESARPPVTP